MNDRMTALEAAHAAAESFRSVDDTEGVAKAVELIWQLETPPGDVDRVSPSIPLERARGRCRLPLFRATGRA